MQMTGTDRSEWHEFKSEIRDNTKGIYKAITLMQKDVATLSTEMNHKVGEAEMIREVDSQMKEHTAHCPLNREVTGVVDVREQRKQDTAETGTIRININGMRPFVRYLIYVIVATGIGLGGHISGKALDKPPVESKGK